VKQYDAIVIAVRAAVGGRIRRFVGPALMLPADHPDWIPYFIEMKNHDPRVSEEDVSTVSFHFYTICDAQNISTYDDMFNQVDDILSVHKRIYDITHADPNREITLVLDEVGTIAFPTYNDSPFVPLPPLYWIASASEFAYYFARQAVEFGVDWIGMSQLAGSPAIPEWGIPDAQFPSVSMVDWATGNPNPRFWMLVLLRQWFPRTTRIFPSQSSDPDTIFAFVTDGGAINYARWLVINKSPDEQCVEFPTIDRRVAYIIDEINGFRPARCVLLDADAMLTLRPFATAIVVEGMAHCP